VGGMLCKLPPIRRDLFDFKVLNECKIKHEVS
jgi:hypothetical protein